MDTARRSLCLALPALVASLGAEPASASAAAPDAQTIASFVKPFDQSPGKAEWNQYFTRYPQWQDRVRLRDGGA